MSIRVHNETAALATRDTDCSNMPKNNIIVLTSYPPRANNARQLGKQLKIGLKVEQILHRLAEHHHDS
jgi:hypothetical protein